MTMADEPRDMLAVAATFARLYAERTAAVRRGDPGSLEWTPPDARVLFSELQAAHRWLTIHDRVELQPHIDAARRRIDRASRKERG